MEANGQSGGPSAWPTAMASFVVISLLVSLLSLGFLVDRSNGTRVVNATTSAASAPAPGFDFGAGAPDGFQARDPNAPKPSPLPAGTVHKVTFDIIEKQVEIAPGVSQLMWTYNGQVPGTDPTRKGRRHVRGDSREPRHDDPPLNRLPCEQGCAERHDANDRPGQQVRVQVHGNPFRHLHVPLRYSADTGTHRHGYVRRGHHRPAEPSSRRPRVRLRPVGALPGERPAPTGRLQQASRRTVGRCRLQRLRRPIHGSADPRSTEPEDPSVGHGRRSAQTSRRST